MLDISLVEFLVYGFVTYASLLMLIISTIKEIPTGKSLSIARAIYLIPGIICAGVLAGSGQDIIFTTDNTSTTTRNLNTSEVWTETITKTSIIELQDPLWITVHVMMFLVMVIYVITQILILLTKHDEKARP